MDRCVCYLIPHFDVGKLRRSGGWDPYNVTEDADLGLRLHALGHSVATITRPTGEDAPDIFIDWRNQRTRWMKGYMQTWLVSLRRPAALTRSIGWRSMLIVQSLLGGVVLSALAHPFVILSMVWLVATNMAGQPSTGSYIPALAAMFDAASVLSAYAAFIGLGLAACSAAERRQMRFGLLLLPLYWMAISLAAWRAVFQLLTQPHLWEKTPHAPAFTPSEPQDVAR
jgi:cellulose synthase/poly-beta-1,6-N-acetylglucosamine synthase-like glycosyltransferase